jgi:hypothetical protein
LKYSVMLGLGALLGIAVAMLPRLSERLGLLPKSSPAGPSAAERAHTERTFEFVADGPMSIVAPLFGAEKERLWAPGWNPTFVWPASAEDRQSMVFAVTSQHGTAVWINTSFEPATGRFQYAYVVPNSMTTLITLNLRPDGRRTHVAVTYSRTALSEDSDALVERMADQDANSGPEWAGQINDYLKSRPSSGAVGD